MKLRIVSLSFQNWIISPSVRLEDVTLTTLVRFRKITLAVLLSFQLLFEDPYGVFAVVLTPTRELAKQIADQFRVFGRTAGVKVVEVVGGMEMLKQSQLLDDKPHIVVATPGRLADHLDR